MNVLEKFKHRRESEQTRREARKLRRSLTHDHRAYIDRIAADVWSDTGDIGEAMRVTEIKVNSDAQSMGFDPSTILLIVQLAILIYKALKQLNVLSPTPDLLSAILETGDE